MRPNSRCFVLLALAALASATGCSHPHVLRKQPIAEHPFSSRAADFEADPGTVVMHYYGSGGWGIRWRNNYLLAAPYFSNHSVQRLLASMALPNSRLSPNEKEVRGGLEGTPVAQTNILLLGHGHIDHVADVPAFFADGLIAGQPTLIADRSTVNELAPVAGHFGCVSSLEFGGEQEAMARCPLDGIRITPIQHGHAPHANPLGIEVAAFGGSVKEPRTTAPGVAGDYKLGGTWAFLIDLLDERGEVAFRIHYVDSAASPPNGLLPKSRMDGRAVDVHIACVPGFEQSEDYPETLLRHFGARYVMAGHWEDFFQPRGEPLRPLRMVLDDPALERFVDSVERSVPRASALSPVNKAETDCAAPGRCGPHGPGWTLPIPGETFRFRTAADRPKLAESLGF
ncbi:MAG TPA: hypothetical protein VGK67_02760 [Myxococcales bacterium]|jgi:hypothetical protein